MILPFEKKVPRHLKPFAYKATISNGVAVLEVFMSRSELERSIFEWAARPTLAEITVKFADGTSVVITTPEKQDDGS
jgi:hypothetical protein